MSVPASLIKFEVPKTLAIGFLVLACITALSGVITAYTYNVIEWRKERRAQQLADAEQRVANAEQLAANAAVSRQRGCCGASRLRTPLILVNKNNFFIWWFSIRL